MIKEAEHLVLLWMRWTGYRGIAMPWAVYIHPDRMWDAHLIRHELKHIEQMQNEGYIRFFTKYLWYSARYGYFDNPYEVEAREAENGYS